MLEKGKQNHLESKKKCTKPKQLMHSHWAWNQYPRPAGGLSQWELHYRLSQVRCPILTSDPHWQSQNKPELKGARARIATAGGKERPEEIAMAVFLDMYFFHFIIYP